MSITRLYLKGQIIRFIIMFLIVKIAVFLIYYEIIVQYQFESITRTIKIYIGQQSQNPCLQVFPPLLQLFGQGRLSVVETYK
ncbi:hypothetical protein pb186bvf_004448 [Paramecium bursaria]